MARHVATIDEARQLATTAIIPILVTPDISLLQPTIMVDAIVAKVNTGTRLSDAPFVVALGPGFTVGVDCHAIVETNRGHSLGRVLYHGSAEPNTGTPGQVAGVAHERVLRAPAVGHVMPMAQIGNMVAAGQLIATVNGQELRAPFAGVLRGLIHPAVKVTPGYKIGDLDPRGHVTHCFTISDKSLAIGGGVVEAVLGERPWAVTYQPN